MKNKPANAYKDLIGQIKIAIDQTLIPTLESNDMLLKAYPRKLVQNMYTLAEIRNFDSLMTYSNEYAVPVFDLKDDQIAQSGAALNSLTEKRDEIK